MRTRNWRLAAIHSLFGYAALHHPERAAVIQRVLAIPAKRHERPLLTWLTAPQAGAPLAAPDRGTWTGRRDHAMLVLAVQTGLRISELIGLSHGDVVLATARASCPSLRTKHATMHTLRHTCAMRLRHAGIDVAVIALWLGHEQMATANIYLHADMEEKERAIARVTPPGTAPGRYQPPDPLLAFLDSL